MVVLRLIGLRIAERTGLEGRYVKAYTPDGQGGRGHLEATDDIAQAKRYHSAIEAMEDWRRVSRTHPTRADGKANRPLSAYSVEVVRSP